MQIELFKFNFFFFLSKQMESLVAKLIETPNSKLLQESYVRMM